MSATKLFSQAEYKLDEYKAKAQPIRDEINSRPLTDFYQLEQSANGQYVCPICKSGTKNKKTGALSIAKGTNHITCFASQCFNANGKIGTDTLGALRILYPDKSECEIFELCGYSVHLDSETSAGGALNWDSEITDDGEPETKPAEVVKPADPPEPPPPPKNYSAEIAAYAEAMSGSAGEDYLRNKRRISAEMIKRFSLGYDADHKAVVIPYDKVGTYYIKRAISDGGKGKHFKMSGVKCPLFNKGALKTSGVCFIVESPLCAISITQVGGRAVAMSGTNGDDGLYKYLQSIEERPTLVILTDDDEPGRIAGEKLDEKLTELGYFSINAVGVLGGHKDPNELLQASEDELKKRIEFATGEALRLRDQKEHEAAEAEAERTGAAQMHLFLQACETRAYEPIPTGITDIDKALYGGFIRGQLVLLGAAPGAGKTALAQFIFENMAKNGTPVIYLNLEMSRDQILARSFSRLLFSSEHMRISPTQILQGYSWTDTQRAAIYRIAEGYGRTIAARMQYNPDSVGASLDVILAYINQKAAEAKRTGGQAPIVCIDYLQILQGNGKEDDGAILKRAVMGFKKYAIEYNTVVLAIMAHNREANKTGTATMEAGRDTSALEYSADLQLALTYTLCEKKQGEKKRDKETLTDEEKKQVTLKVTKGRFCKPGSFTDLIFDGETMTYTQIYREYGTKAVYPKQ